MTESQLKQQHDSITLNDSSSIDLFLEESFQQDTQHIENANQDNEQPGEKSKHTPNKENNDEGIEMHNKNDTPVLIAILKNTSKNKVEEETISQEDTQILLNEFAEESMEIDMSFSGVCSQTENKNEKNLGAISKTLKAQEQEKLRDVVNRMQNFKKIQTIVLHEQQRIQRQRKKMTMKLISGNGKNYLTL